MIVPNAENAVVDIRKLTNYCLNTNHEIGKHKAYIFKSMFDLTVENAERLREELPFAVKNSEAQAGKFDKFGQRHTVDFEMRQGAKKAIIRSGWIIEAEADFPHLTTCFVL